MAIDNKDKKVLNVPHLRFPEFSGEWKKYSFNDIAQYKKGPFGSALKKEIFVPKSADSVKIYEQQNAIKKDWELGRYYISRDYFINHMQQFIVEAGDIIVSCAGTIGEIYELPPNAVSGVFNQALMRVRINATLIDKNIFIKVFSSMIDSFSKIYSNGSAIKNIPPFADLKKTNVFLPTQNEQYKISRLISLLDERIATQNKIIDKLQSLINGIAQNVARNNKPNIRLSECLECSSSTLQESDVCENGTYPVYGANGIVGYIDNYNTEKEAVYIIKDGSGVGTVSYVTGKCSATGTLNTLQAKEGYSLQYLYYMLKVFNFEPYKTGMAIPHIYFKDYGKAKIFCTSYTEQLKYVGLLSAIDNKLSAEQSILTDLSLQKQYLLRQMFI
ncbi:restriction endonuclease subunit S [Phocaeicola vulgatus]|nr:MULTISPECIES: restriction endonuclease subunit S [Bacteroidaceae]MCS2316869.1 restriction endonuclease subunit S [Phocaeicola vulgatus]RHF02367.1 restriction endonuclease subunit S [Bacteroides salyersiae]